MFSCEFCEISKDTLLSGGCFWIFERKYSKNQDNWERKVQFSNSILTLSKLYNFLVLHRFILTHFISLVCFYSPWKQQKKLLGCGKGPVLWDHNTTFLLNPTKFPGSKISCKFDKTRKHTSQNNLAHLMLVISETAWSIAILRVR